MSKSKKNKTVATIEVPSTLDLPRDEQGHPVGNPLPAAPARSKAIAGTGTWRDGLTQTRVDFWNAWAIDFVAKAAAYSKISSSKEDLDLVCELWVMGGKGMNERKLAKILRNQFPLPAPAATPEQAAA